MNEELDNIRAIIRRGIQLSGQSSYARRAADQRAIPLLQEAKARLRAAIESGQADYEVFQLLALTHESLLEYRAAIHAIQECINRSVSPKKDDLKRLARYKEQLNWWETISLSPGELKELGIFLHGKLSSVPEYERSFRWTIAWLNEKKHPSSDKVISGLEQLGACDDFQVLHNIVNG